MQLGARYDIENEPFDGGGYALLFRGIDTRSGKAVAIKLPRPAKNEKTQRSRSSRLKREITTLSGLNHAHIIPLLDHASDFSWYAMPLARDTMASIRPLHGETLMGCVRHVALGLAYAHSTGKIHRDITPWNILWLESSGNPRWVIADWGLVRRSKPKDQTPLTQDGSILGTSGFVAPEVWAGLADARSDIYSLGRVISWALTGQRPSGFKPVTVNDPYWSNFVQSTTELIPENRPQSMHEILLTLDSIRTLQDGESTAEPCSRCGTPSGGTRCRRCGGYLVDYN